MQLVQPSAPGADHGPVSVPDEVLLEGLFRDHHRSIFRAALRVTGNPSDAEDVLQTVFTRLLKRRSENVRETEWSGYLHRAAVNAALDVLRSRSRRRWTALEEGEEPLASGRSPEGEARLKEQQARLRRALATEAPRAAEIFAMRYFEGYRNVEIAELVGISRATVAVTLHRVRARLKKRLGDRS